MTSRGACLLYQVMAATYEPRSMIVTTNIEFSRWGTVLGDDKLANATVDRIMNHPSKGWFAQGL